MEACVTSLVVFSGVLRLLERCLLGEHSLKLEFC